MLCGKQVQEDSQDTANPKDTPDKFPLHPTLQQGVDEELASESFGHAKALRRTDRFTKPSCGKPVHGEVESASKGERRPQPL